MINIHLGLSNAFKIEYNKIIFNQPKNKDMLLHIFVKQCHVIRYKIDNVTRTSECHAKNYYCFVLKVKECHYVTFKSIAKYCPLTVSRFYDYPKQNFKYNLQHLENVFGYYGDDYEYIFLLHAWNYNKRILQIFLHSYLKWNTL